MLNNYQELINIIIENMIIINKIFIQLKDQIRFMKMLKNYIQIYLKNQELSIMKNKKKQER